MKKIGLLFSLLGFVVIIHAQDKVAVKYANTITVQDAFKRLSILASDDFEGRETGKVGAQKAANYIASEFSAFALKAPVNNTYFQRLDLKQKRPLRPVAILSEKPLTFLEDFYLLPDSYTDTDTIFKDFVFVGYGITSENYDDLSNLDLNGKVAIVLSGEPFQNGLSLVTGQTKLSTWSTNPTKKLEALQSKNPAAIIFMDENMTRIKKSAPYFTKQSLVLGEEKEVLSPILHFSESALDKLLKVSGKTVKLIKKDISSSGKSATFSFAANLKLNLKSERIALKADNVLGYLEGSDPILKNELIVITAHYDHLGVDGKGNVFNGADDDASGTTGVLEIAEAFSKAKKDGKGPKRSILFMTVVAEEKGLLGSRWYSENPVFPLENTITNLNIDMIGRVGEHYKNHKDSANYVYVIGSEKLSSTLKQISEDANQKYTNIILDYKYDDPADPNRFYYRSDHYNFAKHNIPIIFYFNGVHEDYHKRTDEIGKINFPLLIKRTQLVFYTAWDLANRPSKPKVDRISDMNH